MTKKGIEIHMLFMYNELVVVFATILQEEDREGLFPKGV